MPMRLQEMKFNYFILTLATLAVVYMWVSSRLTVAETAPTNCTIGYVYDGDTVELICDGHSRAARIVGFDTAETRNASCDSEFAHGNKATERLRELINNADTTYRKVGTDRYNRPLIKLWVDGKSVGEILVAEGLAVPYHGGSRIAWCDRL